MNNKYQKYINKTTHQDPINTLSTSNSIDNSKSLKIPQTRIRNYTLGVFKINEINMSIDTEPTRITPSGAHFYSADRGTAMQIFRLLKDNSPVVLDAPAKLVVLYEFPDLEYAGSIMLDYEIENLNGGVVKKAIPQKILNAGSTRVIQHIYVNFHDGRKIDVGIIEFHVHRSRIDTDLEEWAGVYNQRLEDLAERLEQEFWDRLEDLEFPSLPGPSDPDCGCDENGGSGESNDIISWENIENKPDYFPSNVDKVTGLEEVIANVNEEIKSVKVVRSTYSENNKYNIELSNEFTEIFYVLLNIDDEFTLATVIAGTSATPNITFCAPSTFLSRVLLDNPIEKRDDQHMRITYEYHIPKLEIKAFQQ